MGIKRHSKRTNKQQKNYTDSSPLIAPLPLVHLPPASRHPLQLQGVLARPAIFYYFGLAPSFYVCVALSKQGDNAPAATPHRGWLWRCVAAPFLPQLPLPSWFRLQLWLGQESKNQQLRVTQSKYEHNGAAVDVAQSAMASSLSFGISPILVIHVYVAPWTMPKLKLQLKPPS